LWKGDSPTPFPQSGKQLARPGGRSICDFLCPEAAETKVFIVLGRSTLVVKSDTRAATLERIVPAFNYLPAIYVGDNPVPHDGSLDDIAVAEAGAFAVGYVGEFPKRATPPNDLDVL